MPMPNLSTIRQSLKNHYVRAALAFVVGLTALAAAYQPVKPSTAAPVVQTQDISEITSLADKKANIEYVLLAKPLSDAPRYIYKLKDKPEIHVVKVPSTSHFSLEREILLKNAIPYGIAKDEFLAENKAILKDDTEQGGIVSGVVGFLVKNAIAILMLIVMISMLKGGMPGMTNKAAVIKPKDLKGSMDDLIGMEDIKQEISHLEEMIKNQALYQSHGIDKPFNVMLTGPAGTGKTKLAGYLAQKLDMPLISASGSGLESGFVGGGAKTLNALYKKAKAQGNCIIFLDEAQSLFMPRGKGDKKWEDDTANTLLGLLDGVGVKSDEASRVIWIVASNFDDSSTQMDDAMLRRFAVKINFRLPNKKERTQLLEHFLAKKNDTVVDRENLNLAYVSEITANLSPALLENVVDAASRIAIQEGVRINTDVLFRAFERSMIGLTDRATTAEKEKQRERVAVHELGHFFMQIDPYLRKGLPFSEVKEKSSILKVSTESVSKLGALGYVLSSKDDVALRTRGELEQEVMQLYGGNAAEELFYGEAGVSVGSQNDIQKATKLLDLMVNKLSMYSRAKLDHSHAGKEGDNGKGWAQVEEKSVELYDLTKARLTDYQFIIERMKSELLEKYVLSKDEIFELLEAICSQMAEEPVIEKQVVETTEA